MSNNDSSPPVDPAVQAFTDLFHAAGEACGIFDGAEVISSYSRAQAIDDGTLVDVSEMARQAGFRFPVAVTRAVHEAYVKLTPAAKRACNDERGRLWDILWMARCAIKTAPNGTDTVVYALHVVTEQVRPSLVHLKMVIGPGDDAEPVITIMEPEES